MIRNLAPHFSPGLNSALEAEPVPTEAEHHTSTLARHLFEDAVAARASDVHLDPNRTDYSIRFRVDGVLHDVAKIGQEEGRRLLRHLRTRAELPSPKPHEPQNGCVHLEIRGGAWEVRLSSAPASLGEKMALRLLSRQQLEMRISDLGMSDETLEAIQIWTEDSTGMLLVAGPTGTGKTTTLYALLHELKMRQCSVVTIEDPVEYQIEGVTQIPVFEATGMDFATGLKAMLRLDPDYLLVGEIRDRESAATAIDASGAGRILMSTLHSRDAIGAVTMLRNYGIEDYEIAAALEMVVAQRLVRQLCETCKEQAAPNDAEQRWLDRLRIEQPASSWHPVGCDDCNQTGYFDRLGIFGVWRLNEECEQSILKHADELQLRRALLHRDHPILLQDGLSKAARGLTSITEIQGMGASGQGYLLQYPNHRPRM